METAKYFIVDYDILIAENLTELDLITYAYEKWSEDSEVKDAFEEPDDLVTALEYLDYYYSVIKGEYIWIK